MAWEEIAHTADVALRVQAANLAGLFEDAAAGMVSLIGGENSPDHPGDQRAFNLTAPDTETLLVDWLTEILVLVEDGFYVEGTEVTVHTDTALEGTVRGRWGAEYSSHIKAVTYNELVVEQSEDGFVTTIVFDV
ncbi:MAG: archease [Chloroflexi bacterium]|nr:archease [Chloroflexota bacterium]